MYLEEGNLHRQERSELWNNRADAGAVMPHQQMKPRTPRYPVDRYLVDSSKKIEMVNIIDDVIWDEEPILRPEDEIILRKLHEMLQSTSDDLKQLSGELVKFHQPGIQIKTLPTPLDEEFNEKVHIEEIVNAKFYGHKIVKPSIEQTTIRNQSKTKDSDDTTKGSIQPSSHANNELSFAPKIKQSKKTKNLQISKTRFFNIREEPAKTDRLKARELTESVPVISYNEFVYKYEETKEKSISSNRFQVQAMPKINIRSELKTQKVFQLDIMPDTCTNDKKQFTNDVNVAVLAVNHEDDSIIHKLNTKPNTGSKSPHLLTNNTGIRKISKMSACESSESTNNISSDTKHGFKTQKLTRAVKIASTKRVERTKSNINLPVTSNRNRVISELNEWKKKLNRVYGKSSSARKPKSYTKFSSDIPIVKQSHSVPKITNRPSMLNNVEYIPYARLTLGGVRVSDIENEISDIPNKNDMPLSPLLDKILSSRENSFHNDSPRKLNQNKTTKILTTSDENLLREVLDIEKTVAKTLSKNIKKEQKTKDKEISNEALESDSYDDDFEEEKSNHSEKSLNANDSSSLQSTNSSNKNVSLTHLKNKDCQTGLESSLKDIQNETYTKPSLSLKDSIDVYEFIHSIDRQDTATQSISANKTSLKESQTTPRNERSHIKPINNDLWSSIDPTGEVDHMFKLEKEMIKKLIIDEYGDLFQKSIAKPSSSKINIECDESQNNVATFQKLTQTSPARVKSVMTSPTNKKTRPTSPIHWLQNTNERHTSPMQFPTNEDILRDDSISINLSSPRFSLRLPKNSREVITNLESSKAKSEKIDKVSLTHRVSSSSSLDADKSSSEISSLGEVKLRLKKTLKRVSSLSESSSSSIQSKNSSDLTGILPIRSEGEISLGQAIRCNNKPGKSDGETSVGVPVD